MSRHTTISHEAPAGWNGFVDRQKSASFEQFSWWSDAEATDGWSAIYAVVREGGELVAGAMILTRDMNKVGRIGYVFRGPLGVESQPSTQGTETQACRLLREASRFASLRFLVVVPPYDGAAFVQRALRSGFMLHPSFLPPLSLPQATIAVDLKMDPPLIEKSFRRSTRQEIRAGRKAGIVVEEGGAEDLPEFWRLHEALCQRRGVRSNIPSLDYIKAFWTGFAAHGQAWLFRVRLDEELLCSLICLRAGSICYAWRIGWSGEQADKYPTKVLYAEAMRRVSEAGCEQFDFMEIDPEEAAMLQRGEKPPGRHAGITVFKLGFGGTITPLSPTLVWFPHPLVRLMFRRVIFPLLRFPWIRRHLLRR